MKPFLRDDLTAIVAIGGGAFGSGLITAFLLAGAPGHDTHLTVEVAQEPHVEVHLEALVAHPMEDVAGGVRIAVARGDHAGWFPEGEPEIGAPLPGHVRLESSHGRIILHRRK